MNARAPSPPPIAANVTFVEHQCDSGLSIVVCNYTWRIHNFSFYRDRKNEKLKSSLFTAGASNELQWRLHLYPNGDSEESKDHLSLFLRLQWCDRPEITATFEFAIIDTEGNRTHRATRERRTFHQRPKGHWGSIGYVKFVPVAVLDDASDALLAGDKLTIFCSIRTYKETVHVAGRAERMQLVEVPPCSLAEDMGSLLGDASHSDIVLVVHDEKFYAHRVILTARSRVFAAMLEQGRADSGPQLLNIEDVRAAAFGEMLRYIYTGRAPNLAGLAGELLVAAENFGLDRLKILCEEQLCGNIAVNNAADVLILADRHRAEELKIHARDFIIVHMEAVKDTAGFKRMTHSHPNLVVEALSFLATRINGNLK